MRALFRRWFLPPIPEDSRVIIHRVFLLNAASLTTILFAILMIIGDHLSSRPVKTTLAVDALVLISGMILRHWLYRGRLEWVSIGLLLTTFVYATAVTAFLGTVRAPFTGAFLLLVILSGLLYRGRGIVISTTASSLAVAVLIAAENAGWLPAPDFSVTVEQWITYTALFGISGGLVASVLYNLQQVIDRSAVEIAERRRAEEELRKLLRAVEQSPASIVITDLDGVIEYVNPRFCQVTGYTYEEAVGQNPRILKTALTPPEVYRELWDTLRAGKEWRGEFVNRRKDGTRFTESAIISPISDPSGVTTHYLAVKEDITERKRIEDDLRISEARFRSLYEQTHDAVFILDLQGKHLAANQRAADMLGYRLEEIVQLSVRDISAEEEQSEGIIHRLLAGEHVPLYERKFRKKNGEVFPVEINVELVRDKDGRPLHIQSVVRDISKRKKAEADLRAANEQLTLRVAEVERLQTELREQALRDPLTGLHNRRYLSETLPRELARAQRENLPLSVIVSDVDNFKLINDTYGHQAGDHFLVEIASLIRGCARSSDLACRYGGEEFLLVFPGASLEAAVLRAEEIRRRCAELIVCHEGIELRTTLSFGVATYPDHGTGAEEVIIKADQALYYSKQHGRNLVSVWGEGR